MHIMRKLSTATCDHLHHWSRKGEGFTLPCLLFFYVNLTVDHFVEAQSDGITHTQYGGLHY